MNDLSGRDRDDQDESEASDVDSQQDQPAEQNKPSGFDDTGDFSGGGFGGFAGTGSNDGFGGGGNDGFGMAGSSHQPSTNGDDATNAKSGTAFDGFGSDDSFGKVAAGAFGESVDFDKVLAASGFGDEAGLGKPAPIWLCRSALYGR